MILLLGAFVIVMAFFGIIAYYTKKWYAQNDINRASNRAKLIIAEGKISNLGTYNLVHDILSADRYHKESAELLVALDKLKT